jgi:hypothetical protein
LAEFIHLDSRICVSLFCRDLTAQIDENRLAVTDGLEAQRLQFVTKPATRFPLSDGVTCSVDRDLSDGGLQAFSGG